MKKLCFCLVTVLALNIFCISAVATEGNSTSFTCEEELFRGETTLVTVSLNAEGVSAIAVEPVFDSAVFSLGEGEWLIDGSLVDFDAEEGNGVLALDEAGAINGEILRFELSAKEEAEFGDYSVGCKVTLVDGSGERTVVDAEVTAVTVKCAHSYGYDGLTCTVCGEAREGEVTIGDVNFDEAIDNLDAAFILKHDVWLIELTADAFTAGDINGDGEVDSLDAVAVLRYDAGIIDSF